MPVDIRVGDCVAGLQELPPGSVDLLVADPPYNIGIDYGDGKSADLVSASHYERWTREWIFAAANALSPFGSAFVICGHEYADFHQRALRDAGLHWRNTVVWVESFGVNCLRKFNRTGRPCFYYTRHRKDFTFNRSALTTQSARQRIGDKRANPTGKIFDDVWPISRVCGTFRERVAGVPTQLPLALVRRVVLGLSSPGDTVCDPFTGSGTTAVVCKETGRDFVGFELRESFAAIARKRCGA